MGSVLHRVVHLQEQQDCFKLLPGLCRDVPWVTLQPGAQELLRKETSISTACAAGQHQPLALNLTTKRQLLAPPYLPAASEPTAEGSAAHYYEDASAGNATVDAVLAFIVKRQWHTSSKPLTILRQALAAAIVLQANLDRPTSSMAATTPSKYKMCGGAAGDWGMLASRGQP